jgi:hypothetical protein
MFALCQYCAKHPTDFCIPEFQTLAFEMCLFKSAEFSNVFFWQGNYGNFLLANL